MARLPTAEALGARPTPQPAGGVVSYRPNSGAEEAPAAALAQFGQGLEREGEQLFRIAKVEQEKADTLRAEDAFNQLRDKALELTLGDKGFANVRGADAVTRPIFRDYTAQLDQSSKDIAGGLANDDQRVKFQQRSAIGLRQFQENLLRHVTSERTAYEKEVYDGTVKSELNSIGQQFSDPNTFGLSLERMFSAAAKEVERKGMTNVAGALDTERQNVLDKAWKARLDAWQAADPAGAYAAFQQNANQMSPTLRLQIKQQLAGAALPAIAAGEVSRNAPVVRELAPQPGAPIPGPIKVTPQVEKFATVIDTNAQQYGVDSGVMRRQLQAESGGNPAAQNDADRRVTGEPSIGIAQFQPATAKRYGIDPRDPVQSIRGQAAYMADLLKMFGGDYEKALAGYNWGEGHVQKAVAKHGERWIEHAPASTQAYVRKIVGGEQRGAGFGNRPDGTPKGNGFLGVLKTPGGNVATEYSVGIQIDGKQVDVPTLVPTLTKPEIDAVLKAADDDTGKTPIPESVIEKAASFARQRIAAGKDVFAGPGEGLTTPSKRTRDYASMSPAQLLQMKTGNPVIDAMPADDKLRTLGLIHAEALRQRQEKQALLGTREQDARAAYYVNGTAQNAPTAGELVDAYGPVEGMKRARTLDEARLTGQQIQQVKTLPQSELERLRALKPSEGDGFADRQRNHEVLTQAISAVQQQRQVDPVAYALATKSYGIAPMTGQTLQDPAAVATELRARAGAAAAMAADYGTAPSLLTKPEAQAISTVLKQSPIPAQKQYLAAMYSGIGNMQGYRALLQQVAPDAPTVALAGLYQARQFQAERPSRGKFDVADLILRGHAILNPPQKEDGGQHIGGKSLVKMPKDDELRLAFSSYVGEAFKDKERAKDVIWQAAREIYAARTAEEGDDSGNLSAVRWRSAMELASGGIESHRGAKIVLPWGVPYDSFRDGLRARAEAVAPQAVRATADELVNLPLESVGDGRYVFQRGTGYVVDQAGRPLVVDFNVPAGAPARPGETPRAPGVAAGKLDVQPFAVNRGGAVTGRGR